MDTIAERWSCDPVTGARIRSKVQTASGLRDRQTEAIVRWLLVVVLLASAKDAVKVPASEHEGRVEDLAADRHCDPGDNLPRHWSPP
jgi:hypothetical protein